MKSVAGGRSVTRAVPAAVGLLALWLATLSAGVPGAVAQSTPAPPAPAQATPVTLTGSVVTGTAGAALPAGLSVTATEVDTVAKKVVATRKAPVGPGGTFRIEGFPGQQGDRYLVGTDYLGVTYSSEAQATQTATVKIFETTEDDSVLSIPSETLTVLLGKQGSFAALQLLSVHNRSDRTFVGKPVASGARPTLELPVPSGATNVSPTDGLVASLTFAPDGQPASTDPVLPGNSDLSYLYEVKVARSGWPMSRAVIYPTSRVQILVDPGLRLNGAGLTFKETIPINKRLYRRYEGGALSPGSSLTADITPASTSSATLWLGLGAIFAFLAAMALTVHRLLHRRRQTRVDVAQPAAEERQQLIEEIATLDETHAAGGLAEDEYTAARTILKERLVTLKDDAAADP